MVLLKQEQNKHAPFSLLGYIRHVKLENGKATKKFPLLVRMEMCHAPYGRILLGACASTE
jgi:hypothetical protein